MFTCSICSKTFSSLHALTGHSRMHNPNNGSLHSIRCCCIITKRELPVSMLDKFQASIKQCLYCNTPLSTNRKFCNTSCSAKFYNKMRQAPSNETRRAISETLKKHNANKLKYVGEYCTLFKCTCAHCGTITMRRIQTKYCDACYQLYSPNARTKYKFTFNVYDYPDLFNIELLKSTGFYAPRGKSGKWNPDGLSRDHKISVNEAIKQNYDPYYIKHPLNCELMPHTENNKKKTSCSITYATLKELVDSYDARNQQ